MVIQKNHLQINIIYKGYENIQDILDGKTTKCNTHNKVENVKEMSCLQSKQKTKHRKPK